MTWHRNGGLFEERGHVTDLIVREATAWIEARQSPWFCYVPFTAVHTPIKAPQAWIDTYFGKTYDEDPDRDRSFKVYAAYASHMDWGVGQLVEALERTCQREDTIIVFTSDNGAIPENPIHDTDRYPGRQEDMPRLGSNLPLRGQKAQLYEGGIRTPSLINWPAGRRQPGKGERPDGNHRGRTQARQHFQARRRGVKDGANAAPTGIIQTTIMKGAVGDD